MDMNRCTDVLSITYFFLCEFHILRIHQLKSIKTTHWWIRINSELSTF